MSSDASFFSEKVHYYRVSGFMRKSLTIAILTIIAVLFSGCSSNELDMRKILKEDLQEYTFQESEDFGYMELVREGKIYRS